MTENKVVTNNETEARVLGAATSGQAQAGGSAFEAGQREAATAIDESGPVPWDEGDEWEASDKAGTEPEPGDDLPATDEMFEPETAEAEGSDEEPPGSLKQLNQNMEQLLVTMDGLTADGADSRSMLERLTEGLLENPKAANRAGQIEDRIRVHTADFHRWVERDRRWRRLVPVAAASIAVPAALLLGLLVEQHYQVIPLHDPTGGWRDHIWEHYGRKIFDCTAEAIASKADVNCPLVIRKP